MKNTDFMNLSLPEGADKIDVEILNNDFTAIENLLKQHAIIETMTLNGEGVIIGAIGPYIRLQNIDTVQISIDIGKETYTLASGENVIIRETAENIGIITSGNVHITYFVNPKTYADKEFYTKEKVDELLSKVEGNVEVDAELSETSENPVQNKVITQELASYATTAEVENKVTEKVSALVAGAPERFDTLKELADWIDSHADSAASMNSAIQKNTASIETANANIAKNVEDIETANANIAKNVDDITATKNSIAINKSTLGIQCKNLLKNTATNQKINGITFTVNSDGTITTTGTATTTTSFIVGSVANISGDCVLSGCPAGGSYETYALAVYTGGGTLSSIVDYGNKKTGDFTNQTGTVRIRIVAGTTVDNLIFAPMIRYAEITDDTYEPYQADINTRISAIEPLLNAIGFCALSSYNLKLDTGYVLRVGNQIHINFTATFINACAAWVGSMVRFPFKVKTPNGADRYYIKQMQADGRETSMYIPNGNVSVFTNTAFQVGDVITFPPMILDMYVEEATTTEGGE